MSARTARPTLIIWCPAPTSAILWDNNEYVRYKAYLSTANNKKTPVLSSIQINYVSGCQTPGQWMFNNIAAGSPYTLTVSLSGYQTQNVSGITVGGQRHQRSALEPLRDSNKL